MLREWGSVASLPLMISGVGLMLFGWKLWKLCVLVAFGIMGAAGGTMLAGEILPPVVPALVGALLVAGLAYCFAPKAVIVLGGLIGAGATISILSAARMAEGVVWIGVVLGFFCAAALAHINRRHLIIGVTAFLGAALLVSGLAALTMALPMLFGTFKAMASYSGIVLPFLLVVPTVMSCFYQVSEVHRIREDI